MYIMKLVIIIQCRYIVEIIFRLEVYKIDRRKIYIESSWL